jgi:putative thioredoxin
MMASDHIIDVNEADFEYQVLEFSEATPVVVDFWAEWCIPCRTLSPILEGLAAAANGSFRLAKVNVDQNPNLATRYSVRSIPAVKAFRDGKVISEFTGLQPEPRVQEFIRGIAPSADDLKLEKATALLELGKYQEAEAAFRNVMENKPERPGAMLGLAKSLLAQGRAREAQNILVHIPPSKEYAIAEKLRPLAGALLRLENGQFYSDDPLEAAYNHALRLIARGNIPAAMDGLLDVLRQDKHYHHDEVRLSLVALLELLGDTTNSRQYRQELSSVLF